MKTKRSKALTLDSCQFPFADGRQCRMLRHKDHPSLCLFHAREEQQLLESPKLGAEISASLSGSFYYATDINHVLGKVFAAFAQRRISQRDAATMAYLGQLMLQSVPTVKEETSFEYTYKDWLHMDDNAVRLSQAAWPGLRSPITEKISTTSVPAAPPASPPATTNSK
jgi:hypothetical protein